MNKYKILFFAIVLFCFSCENDKPTTATTKPTTAEATSNDVEKTTESKTDFWTKRNCTRGIPGPVVNKAQRVEGYSFKLDRVKGRSIEKVNFDKEVL